MKLQYTHVSFFYWFYTQAENCCFMIALLCNIKFDSKKKKKKNMLLLGPELINVQRNLCPIAEGLVVPWKSF